MLSTDIASKDFIRMLEDLIKEKNALVRKLKQDKTPTIVLSYCKSKSNIEDLCNHMVINDMLTCILKIGKGKNLRTSVESLALAHMATNELTNEFINALRGNGINILSLRRIDKIKAISPKEFGFFKILKSVQYSGVSQYASFLIRCAQVFCRVDGIIDKEESTALIRLNNEINGNSKDRKSSNSSSKINLGDKEVNIDSTSLSKESQESESLGNVLDELNSLIGLATVKEEVQSLINFIKIQEKRRKQGIKSNDLGLHCVFTGAPGTGKTTVARLLSRVYKQLGLLSVGNLVETDRAGLVASYVGQSESKTTKKIEQAMGGTLFIDEAYSLSNQGKSDYGDEVIAVLLKQMEDQRGDLSIIVAGYSNEMNEFIESNPGLRSRFNRFIHFPDYSSEELFMIYDSMVSSAQYKLNEAAVVRAKSIIESITRNKGKDFGNAREMRNLFEETIENHSTRISNMPYVDREALIEIYAQDIPYE